MKQSFLTLTKLLFGVIVLLVNFEVVRADNVTIDGIKYVTSSATATVTGYTSDISKDVVIPASISNNGKIYRVTSISSGAFSNCKKLESISIPASVIQIATTSQYPSCQSFDGCTSLKYVKFEDGSTSITLCSYYKGDYYYGTFYGCPIEEVYIGRNIKGVSPFGINRDLRTVIIGPMVTNIPAKLFYQCYEIENLISVSENPAPIEDSNAFYYYNAKLYVPKNAEPLYASANYWKKFNERFELISEGNLLYIPNGENTVAVTKYPGTSPSRLLFLPPLVTI